MVVPVRVQAFFNYFSTNGTWHGNFYQSWSYNGKSGTNTKDSSYTPQVGDVVLLETDNNKSNGPDHTGIVVGVSGSTVTTVEGNIGTEDKVATFTYDRWSSFMFPSLMAIPEKK